MVSTTSSWSKRSFSFFDSKEGKNEKFGSSKEEKKKRMRVNRKFLSHYFLCRISSQEGH